MKGCKIFITSFLLPPSCMAAPIGDIVNKFLFFPLSPSITSNSTASALSTMSSSNHTGMDSSKGQTPTNDFKVRGRTSSSTINISREPSMASSGRATLYHDKINNQMDCDSEPEDKTPGLSYETKQEKASCFNRVLEATRNTRPQGGSNEATHLMSLTSSSHMTLMLLLN